MISFKKKKKKRVRTPSEKSRKHTQFTIKKSHSFYIEYQVGVGGGGKIQYTLAKLIYHFSTVLWYFKRAIIHPNADNYIISKE